MFFKIIIDSVSEVLGKRYFFVFLVKLEIVIIFLDVFLQCQKNFRIWMFFYIMSLYLVDYFQEVYCSGFISWLLEQEVVLDGVVRVVRVFRVTFLTIVRDWYCFEVFLGQVGFVAYGSLVRVFSFVGFRRGRVDIFFVRLVLFSFFIFLG